MRCTASIALVSETDDRKRRFKRVLEANGGISQNEVERRMGMSEGYLAKVLKDGRDPKGDAHQKFGEVTGYRFAWVISGQGSATTVEAAETDTPEMTTVFTSARARGWPVEVVEGVRAFCARSQERLTEADILRIGESLEGARLLIARPVADPTENRRKKR